MEQTEQMALTTFLHLHSRFAEQMMLHWASFGKPALSAAEHHFLLKLRKLVGLEKLCVTGTPPRGKSTLEKPVRHR